MQYSKEFLRKLYKDLLDARLFEQKMVDIYALGKIPGHIHSGVGDEACFVGTLATRKEGDYIKPTHRLTGAARLAGMEWNDILAELLGKVGGNALGMGGVLHIVDLDKGLLGFSGTLACDAGIANGAALKIQNTEPPVDNIVYLFFGDGTSSRGPIHEAMNMAAVWKLPVLFVCENNQFAISTPASYGVSVPNVSVRAAAYGMPGVTADGSDVLDVYEKARSLVEGIRAGNGPALLECKNYRWRGHFEGDQCKYRDASVTEEWMKKDSVAKLEKILIDNDVMTQDEIDAQRQKVDGELEAAIALAEAMPEPTVEDLYRNLYV